MGARVVVVASTCAVIEVEGSADEIIWRIRLPGAAKGQQRHGRTGGATSTAARRQQQPRRRGWKRMEEDGRGWKRMEEDGERRKVVVHASVLGWAAHLSPLTCLHVERGREATESDGTWA